MYMHTLFNYTIIHVVFTGDAFLNGALTVYKGLQLCNLIICKKKLCSDNFYFMGERVEEV